MSNQGAGMGKMQDNLQKNSVPFVLYLIIQTERPSGEGFSCKTAVEMTASGTTGTTWPPQER